MSAPLLTRRTALAGAATLAAVPLQAVAAVAPTPIARLWTEAQRLDRALGVHRAAIASAEALRQAAPGWMYLSGEGHALGQRRYEALVAILKETPRGASDHAIMAKASQHRDILRGPHAWASFKVAEAAAAVAA